MNIGINFDGVLKEVVLYCNQNYFQLLVIGTYDSPFLDDIYCLINRKILLFNIDWKEMSFTCCW
jgi:hypothetical protein